MKDNRPFSNEDWLATPKPVRDYIEQVEPTVQFLMEQVRTLTERVEKLENQLNKNSNNSSKPSSSDPPHKKPRKASPKQKGRNEKKGGAKRSSRTSTETFACRPALPVMPKRCSCGCNSFNSKDFIPFHTHQVIELPPIQMDVTHFILMKGMCPSCRKVIKAEIPRENRAGYGPRLSAVIVELSGTYGNSWETIQDICRNILNFHISTGAVQKVIDRASHAILPIYDHIGFIARRSPEVALDNVQ